MTSIVFVGGGNMATALAKGLGAQEKTITAIDPDKSALERISKAVPGINVSETYAPVNGADIVVLAVKPQIAQQASKELAAQLGDNKPLIISIAAGITLQQLRDWLGALPIVRCMPNTPALLGCGITALSGNDSCNPEDAKRAQAVLDAVGTTLWCEEEQMDAITAVSGSGPAYFFATTEAIVKAGRSLGLPDELAKQLSIKTALGAARMMDEPGTDISELRERVTSPGGTTESALSVLQGEGFEKLWANAIDAAAKRSAELSTVLAKNEESS